jgi:hypothetical protein
VFEGPFEQFWSAAFPDLEGPGYEIFASDEDVDYKGDQDIFAWYAMADVPLSKSVRVIGGARFESTKIKTVNSAEQFATWLPENATSPQDLDPGEAGRRVQPGRRAARDRVRHPTDRTTFVAARVQRDGCAPDVQGADEPISQQEYAGGPVFVGNPEWR